MTSSGLEPLAEAAVRRARTWIAATRDGGTRAERRSTGQLAALVHGRDGVEFTLRFVDRVARPEDDGVAAAEFAALAAGGAPPFLGAGDRALMRLGARTARLAPHLVMPLARRRMRSLVGHLVQDAGGPRLRRALARAAAEGVRLNLNLLGEAVLGEDEAARRLRRTLDLLRMPEVDHVSVKASSVASQLDPWDLDGSRERLVRTLLPLYRAARDRARPAFVNLDMEEYKDLHLTLDVFEELMARPELVGLPAGVVLQAYLPDAVDATERLAAFARHRVAEGGAPVKLRLVKGANLAMERVEAQLHGWPQAPYTEKADVDANYVRLLGAVLRPELAGALRLGAASHNLFDVALAHELALARGVEHQLDVEMLRGMAPAQARAVRADTGSMVLYTPVVHPGDLDAAVSYLVRRLEENAAPENYLYAQFSPPLRRPAALAEQEQRFRDSVTADPPSCPRRTQDRSDETVWIPGVFANVPDTDPALPVNRAWARAALAAAPPPVTGRRVDDPAEVDAVVATGLASDWSYRPAAERAELLRAAAAHLAAARGDLLTVMAHEAGKTVAEADPEISEAIDFAAYYADRALELSRPGTVFTPFRLVVVTPPWNFPLAIALGGVLAALAAGCAVVIKPAPQTPAVAEAGVAALHRAGIPADALQLVHTGEGEAGRRLITHPDVEAVVLTGSTETATTFRGWRPGLRLLAETSGKNALVVTPAADPDLAVADVLRSAFGHAGQKCSAASLLIAVGSVATSGRFRRQLADAVRSLRVGPATEPGSVMGPLIEPAAGKLLRALTTLEDGETWLVPPRRLDAEGRLWTPGVKDGVRPGSFFHTTEVFGPVLGMMAAADLDQALEWQNATGFGLTGGLHSLDDAEISTWCERVEVGNAYVNRHTTGAVVQRQPFGGWKASVVGPGAKAGGPNYVAQFGTWRDDDAVAGPADDAWLARAAASDAAAWRDEFAVEHDPTALAVEANVFRYRPLPRMVVRVAPGHDRALERVRRAAARTGTDLVVSRAESEPDADFAARLTPDWQRLRALGPLPEPVLRAAATAGLTVLDADPVADGRRELLTLLREQAISRTRHRFGHLPG
jgi:RHH-type proline utilization regulon transcriptional repressor/proline dehydrogenase/delta 1-pyrroline-5-carboxylate dehydrogenase